MEMLADRLEYCSEGGTGLSFPSFPSPKRRSSEFTRAHFDPLIAGSCDRGQCKSEHSGERL